jgi:UDP:flavonoid glycosyltransferase YjiC (YdhE family)
MRILVVADGTRGDVQPMQVLASMLKNEGHRLTVAAPPGMRATIESAQLPFVPLALDTGAMMSELSAAVVAGPRAVLRAAPRFLVGSLDSQMAVLPELVRDADFVLCGGIHVAISSLAERYDVPWRWVVFSVTALPSSWHPPMVLPIGRAPRAVNWLAWHLSRALLNRALREPLNAHRARLGLPALHDVAAALQCPNPIVAIDPELAPLAPDMQHHDVVGHLDAGAGDELPDELERFLADGAPPVYVGFGSMTDPDPAATTRQVIEAAQRASCRVILSRGWAGLGAQPLPPGCLAVGPVSHSRLLPRVAAIVHHGGAGTTAAAARAGVPQLIMPHLADQYHYAAHVHALGVGARPLRRAALRADTLGRRLQTLLHDEAMRERARALAARIAARPPLARASRLLTTAPRASRRPAQVRAMGRVAAVRSVPPS